MNFVLFLERSKGFEEDAKKFLFLTRQSSHLQIDYQMIKPIINRIIKFKGGHEVLKFFEQLRKNIQLNRSWDSADRAEKADTLRALRKEFYDGLIQDLMGHNNYNLAEIVMVEKLKEKFSISMQDELIGLHIFAGQQKLAQYREKFEIFLNEELDEEFRLNYETAQELGQTMMSFDTEEFKNDRLMLSEKLVRKMQEYQIPCAGDLFHNLVYIYTESQQWESIATFLRAQTAAGTCEPAHKTLGYLKSNIVFCFNNSTRMEIQEALGEFEQAYYRGQPRRTHITERPSATRDTIEEDDHKELGQKDKKLLRREARRSKSASADPDQGEGPEAEQTASQAGSPQKALDPKKFFGKRSA